jgi:hypothetical protein
MTDNRYAVILTHNRPELLRQTWEAIGPQVDMVIIIDNASDPPVNFEDYHGETWRTAVVAIPDQPPNLANLWNRGISQTMLMYATQRGPIGETLSPYIAFLCDDAPPPAGWFEAVTAAMAETGAVVGCSDPWNSMPAGTCRLKTDHSGGLGERMPGHAWILDPISPIRADETMRWWWCDTDIDWQARLAGGMVMVGGFPVHNIHPNDFTTRRPELGQQAGEDGLTFAAKWGGRPW